MCFCRADEICCKKECGIIIVDSIIFTQSLKARILIPTYWGVFSRCGQCWCVNGSCLEMQWMFECIWTPEAEAEVWEALNL